jgi:hypothetical protein
VFRILARCAHRSAEQGPLGRCDRIGGRKNAMHLGALASRYRVASHRWGPCSAVRGSTWLWFAPCLTPISRVFQPAMVCYQCGSALRSLLPKLSRELGGRDTSLAPSMAWSDPVASYCERLAPGLLGEPLNSLTNIAFAAAGVALLSLQTRLQARGERLPADVRALPWLVSGVAACSLLFHTLATRWAGWLDSFSILLYCASAVYSFVRHAAGAGNAVAAAAAVVFVAASLGSSRLLPPGMLNGSAAYFPNLLTLLAATMYLRIRRARGFRSFALATGIFAAALILRTVDRAWCSVFPIGTHFLWHLLTGLLLWLVSRELTLRRYRFSG